MFAAETSLRPSGKSRRVSLQFCVEGRSFLQTGGSFLVAKDVVIVAGARTPMTDYVGAFKDVSALELGAVAARGALERAGARPEWVDHVVMGNALQTSGDAI
jgi:hypothetical protein